MSNYIFHMYDTGLPYLDKKCKLALQNQKVVRDSNPQPQKRGGKNGKVAPEAFLPLPNNVKQTQQKKNQGRHLEVKKEREKEAEHDCVKPDDSAANLISQKKGRQKVTRGNHQQRK